MRRFFVGALVLVAVLGNFSGADAGKLKQWWAAVCRDYNRSKMWPEPRVIPDRNATVAPFTVEVANGWREQNMLTDEHFGDDDQLNEAGRLKIADIMRNSPLKYRSIYVDRTNNADDTADRVASAEKYAAEISYDGDVPPVIAAVSKRPAAPADYVENIQRQFDETTPPPRLPEDDGPLSGGGGSSSSGS